MLPANVSHHTVPQGSEAWRTLRLGVLTGSRAYGVTTKSRTAGAPSETRKNLLTELVLETLPGKTQAKDVSDRPAVQDGLEREPLARRRCEAVEGWVIQESGFLRVVGSPVGCSLDGYLGDFSELISIKCRQPKAHYAHLRTGEIPKDARVQMAHELWVTGAEGHHYVSFNPDFPERLQYHRVAFTRANVIDGGVDAYAEMAEAFLEELKLEVASATAMELLEDGHGR